MRLIPLTKGYSTMVDDADFERLSQCKWQAHVTKHTVYATGSPKNAQGKRVRIRMHRFIMGVTDQKIQVDHKDRDGLNNTRGNMRQSTAQENCMNRGRRNGSSSKFKGVSWNKNGKRWLAAISVAGKKMRIGLFDTEDEAARQFNYMARLHQGEFAVYNDVSPMFPETLREIPILINTNKSGYRGVTIHVATNKWYTCIRQNGKSKYLGLFKEVTDAARAYDQAAREIHGDLARLNFPNEAAVTHSNGPAFKAALEKFWAENEGE